MALAIAQHSSGWGPGSSASTPGSVTVPVTPTVGNLILVSLGVDCALSALTFNTSSWTIEKSADDGTNVGAYLLYRYVQAGDTTALPAFCTGAGTTLWGWEMYEVSGVSGIIGSDIEAVVSGYFTSSQAPFVTTTSQTTANNNDLALIFGFVLNYGAEIWYHSGGVWGNEVKAFIGWSGFNTGDSVTLNTGATAFNMTPPSGFSAFDSSGATTWDSASKGSAIVLSGGNLIATSTSGGSWTGASVRTNGGHGTGKYYYEFFITGFPGLSSYEQIFGICTKDVSTNSYMGSDNFGVGEVNNGVGFGLPSWQGLPGSPVGVYVGVAINYDTGETWIRTSANTDWNNSGSADPATDTGGASYNTNAPIFPICPIAGYADEQSFDYPYYGALASGSQAFPTSGSNVQTELLVGNGSNPVSYIQIVLKVGSPPPVTSNIFIACMG